MNQEFEFSDRSSLVLLILIEGIEYGPKQAFMSVISWSVTFMSALLKGLTNSDPMRGAMAVFCAHYS